jgi:hypothetical protein
MRVITVVALLAAALLPSTAIAKEGLELSTLPDGLMAGQSWDTDIRAFPPRHDLPQTHGIAIQITKQGSGEQRDFPAARQADGSYRVRVVFPSPGTWDYYVVGLGTYHQQNWAPVHIAAAPEESSFPWGWIAGGGALALLALVVARFRPWRSSPSPPSVDPPPFSS